MLVIALACVAALLGIACVAVVIAPEGNLGKARYLARVSAPTLAAQL